MKRFYIVFLFVMLWPASAFSQTNSSAAKIEVIEFQLTNTLEAQMPDTRKDDGNGGNCALIKIRSNPVIDGFSFEAGQSGVEFEEKPGETWVYLPAGTRSITIRHPKLNPLDHYAFPLAIGEGKVYIMNLSVGIVETVVKPRDPQFVVFTVSPPDAILKFDGEQATLDDEGKWASDLKPQGTYKWEARAKNYHPKNGTVKVLNEKVECYITLEPAFGFLDVRGKGLDGETIIIDDEIKMKLPLTSYELKSGSHKLTIQKKYHETYTQSFKIKDGEHLAITPELIPNALTVRITSSDSKAEIWLKNELLGTGSWEGMLSYGKYVVEARRKNCEPRFSPIVVKKGESGQSFTITPPQPITGSLRIDSEPKFADIVLDGKSIGQTPMVVSDIEIGSHTISLSKEGYISLSSNVIISKGEQTLHNPTLKKGEPYAYITVTNPGNVSILKDSRFLTNGPSWSGYLPKGTYKFESFLDADHDNGVYNLTVTDFSPRKINLPAPTLKKGKLTIHVSPSSANLTLDKLQLYPVNGKYSSDSFSVGHHTVHASAPNYDDHTEDITVSSDVMTEINIRLKPHKFTSLYSGVQLGYDIYNKSFLTGAYLNWQPSFVGLYGSASVGWKEFSYYLTGGASVRFTPKYSETSFSVYGGAGWSTYGLIYDAGLQLGFDEGDTTYGKYNIRAGSMYIPSSKSFIPTLSLSWHIPAMAVYKPVEFLFSNDYLYDYIPLHSLFTASYDLSYEEFLFGTDIMWTKDRIGVFGGFMYGLENTISLSLGPSFRLSSVFDWERADLNLYSSFGVFDGAFLTRFGLLLGLDTPDRHAVFSLRDFELGAGVHDKQFMFTFGMDWLTTSATAATGLLVLLCMLPFI